MATLLEWYDDKSRIWVKLNPAKHSTLVTGQKYRIRDSLVPFNIVFSGEQWDASIMNNIENLSYWAAYIGVEFKSWMDGDRYYEGRMDQESDPDEDSGKALLIDE